MGRVEGKAAIVTGAAIGLGKAQAMLLAKEGAKVVVTDIDEVRGKEAVEDIISNGGEAIFKKHDVSSESDWDGLIKDTVAKFGKLDILVNNAGIFLQKSIENTTLEEWRRVMRVNVEGVFLGMKYAIGAMKRSGGGSIINLSSAGGIMGTPNSSAYAASKGAVRTLTKVAAWECSDAGYGYNIRVNSVHPGAIGETELTSAVSQEELEAGPNPLDWLLIKRLGEPKDIAYGVLYLASDESKIVTGAELCIDQGWTAH